MLFPLNKFLCFNLLESLEHHIRLKIIMHQLARNILKKKLSQEAEYLIMLVGIEKTIGKEDIVLVLLQVMNIFANSDSTIMASGSLAILNVIANLILHIYS